MGRYYDGDIEGKFWFGVQSSDDADFFGVEGYQPNYLHYNYEKEDLPKIEEGVKKCFEELGIYKEKIDEFFNGADCYNNEEMAKSLEITEIKLKELLTWYARLELGLKIRKCVIENDSCSFEAEC